MQRLQILDGARTAEIEGVLANADVAGVVPLALRNMCELVFDHGALPQRRAARGRLDLFAEAVLQRLVLGDRDGAAVPEFGGGALIAPRAVIADVGVELDNRAEREALHLSARTCDRAVTEIQRKRGFGEQPAVVRLPGLAHDLAAAGEHVVHQGAVDVPAIDHQLVNGEGLPLQVRLQCGHGFFLGAIRRGDRARQDQAVIDIRCDVTLEAIERLLLLLRPCRIAVSAIETRRSSATPWRMRTPPTGSGSRSWVRICARVASCALSGGIAISSASRVASQACRASS